MSDLHYITGGLAEQEDIKVASVRRCIKGSCDDLLLEKRKNLNTFHLFSLSNLAHLFIKPVSLDDWGTGVPSNGVGSLPKVVNLFRRPRGLQTQHVRAQHSGWFCVVLLARHVSLTLPAGLSALVVLSEPPV